MEFELPKSLINALTSNEYVKKPGYSVTTLINPPQIQALKDRYGEDPKEDPIDNIWSIMGTAIHNYLEKYAVEGALAEVSTVVDIHGNTVNGTSDLSEENNLYDYKITKAYKYVFKGFEDWEKQLNMYNYLAKMKHENLFIVGIWRDWNENDALRNRQYPKKPITVIQMPRWDEKKCLTFIEERVKLHSEAAKLSDDKLPECTEAERWARPTKYAVMKKGIKRASKLHDNLQDAEAMASKNPKMYVELRGGESVRCQKYCPVASKCQQKWRDNL